MGPKRASKIRKLFNLTKEDDVCQYVIKRPLPLKEGKKQKFKCNVREVFGKDATLRQISEAVDIRREKAGMNNKFEWGHTSLPKLGWE